MNRLFLSLILLLSVFHNLAQAGPTTTLSMTPVSDGTTYYVSGDGNDTNSGLSVSRALRNLQTATDRTQPGDTVLVMNGEYTAPGSGSHVLLISNSGKVGRWISFRAYEGHTPHIKVNEHWAGIKVSGASYILIEGFVVEGNAANVSLDYAMGEMSNLRNPVTSGGCIAVRENWKDKTRFPHHVIVRRNHVFNCPGGGIESRHADYLTIEHNIVHHNAFYSPYANSGISVYLNSNSDNSNAAKIYIRDNFSYANENKVPHYYSNPEDPASRTITDGNGIIVDDTRNVQSDLSSERYKGRTVVERNVVHENGGRGIGVYLSDNVIVRNNKSSGNGRSPSMSEDVAVNRSENIRLISNVIVSRPDREPLREYNSVNVVLERNQLY